jgi:hypothetical protein
MKPQLRTDHPLFERLKKESPKWWENLKSDPELYIDIRKNNYLNVYHNGGSIMRLNGTKKYNANINIEYIPLNRTGNYESFIFKDQNILLNENKTIKLNNFEEESLELIKKRVRGYYPNRSEKGLQGNYVIYAKNKSKTKDGFFIDTELQHSNKRIDLIWVDLKNKKIAFVELKTIGDERLYIDDGKNQETIDAQLNKYYEFSRKYKEIILDYYNKVFCIKRELGLLPNFVKEKSLSNFDLIEKPILLVGDCTRKWIHKNAEELNDQLRGIAFGCVYQGKTSFQFRVPYKSIRYSFRLI